MVKVEFRLGNTADSLRLPLKIVETDMFKYPSKERHDTGTLQDKYLRS